MKKSSTFVYEKSVFLNEKRMDELRNILLKYCDRLIFRAKTIENTSIEFDSYDELMQYDNYKKSRIKSLDITGYKNESLISHIDLNFTTEYPALRSVRCVYKFEQVDEDTLFGKEIREFIDKANNCRTPYYMYVFIFVIFIMAVLTIFELLFLKVSFSISIFHCMVTTIGLTILSILLWQKIFPIVSFSWGEATAYYEKIKKLRYSIFWSVGVASVVSITAGVISGILLAS